MIRIDAVWLAVEPLDMRAGTETGLARVIRVFGEARAHHAYLFANRRANRLKLLVHDGIGIWLCARRLHQGRFIWASPESGSQLTISSEQMQALVIGLPWCRIGAQATIRVDFVSDQLADGTRFRALTVVDSFSGEALAIEVGQRLGGEHVVAVLNRLAAKRQAPKYLFVDNGSEFSGRLLDLWAYHFQVRIDFGRPGKPTDNCYVETFNGSLRDECLNVHWFETIEDAKAIIEAWRRDYNETRPHTALNDVPPEEYARISGAQNARN